MAAGEHISPADPCVDQQMADSPVPSCVSMQSNMSKVCPIGFRDGRHSAEGRAQELKSDVLSHQRVQQNPSDLDSIFLHLEENIVTFVKNELKKFKKILNPDHPECLEDEEEEQRSSGREAFLKITLDFLRRMMQEHLADCLQSRSGAAVCRRELKSRLKKKHQHVFEGIAKAGTRTLLKEIFTELYITEGGTAEVNDEHEVRQIETASRRKEYPETPIKCEVAGIGKTVLTQKFTLDWAEDKAKQS